jgi:hypothetical protein
MPIVDGDPQLHTCALLTNGDEVSELTDATIRCKLQNRIDHEGDQKLFTDFDAGTTILKNHPLMRITVRC